MKLFWCFQRFHGSACISIAKLYVQNFRLRNILVCYSIMRFYFIFYFFFSTVCERACDFRIKFRLDFNCLLIRNKESWLFSSENAHVQSILCLPLFYGNSLGESCWLHFCVIIYIYVCVCVYLRRKLMYRTLILEANNNSKQQQKSANCLLFESDLHVLFALWKLPQLSFRINFKRFAHNIWNCWENLLVHFNFCIDTIWIGTTDQWEQLRHKSNVFFFFFRHFVWFQFTSSMWIHLYYFHFTVNCDGYR